MKNKGFTLIELMVVVAIIGILATISWPSYVQYVLKGQRSSALPQLQALLNLQEDYHRDSGGNYTIKLKDDLGYPSDPVLMASSGGADIYSVKASACDDATIYPDTPSLVQCIKIIATPVGRQVEDGLILMDNRGRFVLDFAKNQLKNRDGADLPNSACPECLAERAKY